MADWTRCRRFQGGPAFVIECDGPSRSDCFSCQTTACNVRPASCPPRRCPPQSACVAAYAGEPPVDGEIVVCHALDRESALERRPDLGTVEYGQPAYGRRRLRLVVDNKARDALIDNLGYRARPEGYDRRAAGHRFDHHQPERLGPVDREEQRQRVAKEFRLLRFVDLTHELDVAMPADQRCDDRVPVDTVDFVDFGRDLERQPGACRDLDGAVGPLLRRNTAKEGEVSAARVCGEGQQILRQSMWHRAGPAYRGQRKALAVGYRDQRDVRKGGVVGLEVGKVEAAVQGRQRAVGETGHEREMQQINMEMDDVEIVGLAAHVVQHHQMVGQGVLDGGIESQGHVRAADQFRRGPRVAAGKQGDVVALMNKFFGEVGNHPLGAAVEVGRHAFHQRGNLRNPHVTTHPS